MDILIRPFRLIWRLSALILSFTLMSVLVIDGFFVILFLWRFLIFIIPAGVFLIVVFGFLKVMSDP